MGTTKSKGRKDELDRFFTPDEVSQRCIDSLDLGKYDVIIEPSAGGGSFSNKIEGVIAYDIEPAADGIQKADWFEVDKSQFKGKVLIVGNPPFGQQNSLATRFFNESATFAETIAFILPKTFRKASIQNRLDLNFHLSSELDLGDVAFDMEGEKITVPCVFQVWDRGAAKRKKKRLRTTTELFDFVSKDEADFRIQRVGGNAGKASFDLNYSVQSNYFVKNRTDMTNEEFVELINNTVFAGATDTVGPKSVGKGEMIATLEEILLEEEN